MPGPVANMGGYTEPRYVVIRSPRGNFMPHKTGASPVEYTKNNVRADNLAFNQLMPELLRCFNVYQAYIFFGWLWRCVVGTELVATSNLFVIIDTAFTY
jgi:hypothetical protein